MAAKGQRLALAIEHLHAQHMVTHAAHHRTGRTGQTTGHHAAHGGIALAVDRKVRRLECQALALLGQHGFQLCQRRAATHGDHQLAGLVADDAAVGTGV